MAYTSQKSHFATYTEGTQGKDGNCIEYVYYRSENEQKNLQAPSYTGTTLTTGWSDSPQGITEEYKYEYMSVRTKPAGTNTDWSPFSPPVIWSKWGEKGQDGDGIEYKYCLTNSTVKPLYPAPDDSYVWTDEPSGVSIENRYEYVVSLVVSPIESTAKKINTEIRNFPLEGDESWSFYGKKGHEENWTIRGTGNLDNSHIYLGDYAYVEGFVQDTETPVKLYGKVIELYNSSVQQGYIKMRSTHLVIGDHKTPTSTVSLWSNYSQPGREEIKRDRYYCITNENKAPLLYENFNDPTRWWKHPSDSVQFSENGLQIFVDDTIDDVTVFAMKAEQWPESRLVSFEGWITSEDDDDGADVDEFDLNCDLVPRNHAAPEDGYPQFIPRLTKERRRYSYLMELGPEANINNNKEVSLRLFSDISHNDNGDRVPNDIYIENLIIQPLSNNTTWTKNTYASLEKGQYLWSFDIIEYSKEDAFGNKYSVTPIEQRAYLATDGTSPYLVSFDNDSATIGATKDGSVNETTLADVSKVTVTVYLGKDKITEDCIFNWSVTAGSTLNSSSGYQNWFTGLGTDTATATVSVTLRDNTPVGTKTFTISKSRTGQTGDDAVTYKLSVSPNSVNLTTNPDGVAPSFIVTKYTGSTVENILSGYTIAREDGLAINTSIKSKAIFLLKVSGKTVDTETVDVVENGGKGDTGDTGIQGTKTESIRVFYSKKENGELIGPSGTPASENKLSTWTTYEPTSSGDYKYTWSCTGVKTTTYNASGGEESVTYGSWTTPELYKAYIDKVDPFAAAEYLKLTDFENKKTLTYGDNGELYINATYINTGALTVTKGGDGDDKNSVVFSAGWGKDDNNNDIGVVNLAGWDITENAITKTVSHPVADMSYSNTVSIQSVKVPETHVFSINFADDEKFYVRADGYLHSTYGNIAGWEITEDSLQSKLILYGSTPNNKTYNRTFIRSPKESTSKVFGIERVAISNTDNSITVSNGPFYVNAKGEIYATAGEIGGWNIGTGRIESDNIHLLGTNYSNYHPSSLVNPEGFSYIRIYEGAASATTYRTDTYNTTECSNVTTFRFTNTRGKDYIVTGWNKNTSYPDGYKITAETNASVTKVTYSGSDFLVTVKPTTSGQNAGACTITVSYYNIKKPTFMLLEDGSLYASAANISGTITANEGKIAGWLIEANSLTKFGTEKVDSSGKGVGLFENSIYFSNNPSSGNYAIAVGTYNKNTLDVGEKGWEFANFKVDYNGNVETKSLNCGNWSLSSQGISYSSGGLKLQEGKIVLGDYSIYRGSHRLGGYDLELLGTSCGFYIRNPVPSTTTSKITLKWSHNIFTGLTFSATLDKVPTNDMSVEIYWCVNHKLKNSQDRPRTKHDSFILNFNQNNQNSTNTKYLSFSDLGCNGDIDYLGLGLSKISAISDATDQTDNNGRNCDSGGSYNFKGETVLFPTSSVGCNYSRTHFIPYADNTYDLGMLNDSNNESLNNTWRNLYCSSTVYCKDLRYSNSYSQENWSDIRVKNSISALPVEYEVFFDKMEPSRYKYNEGTSNRYHTGFIAQQLVIALEESGLTTQDFAGVMLDQPGTENECWYLRRDEFVALNTWQIQKLKPRVSTLEQTILDYESRISKLETEIQNLKSI